MDWAELNPDLLRLVANKLGDVSNLIRFRSVCNKWRSAGLPSNPSPQLPWFISSKFLNKRPSSFYSLYSNKIHNISIPEAHHKFIEGGPSKHYLLLVGFDANWEYSFTFLLNPLTKTQIPLPSKDLRYYIPVYIGPPPSPTNNGVVNDVLVILFCSKDSSLASSASWQSNDGVWTHIEVPMGIDAMAYYEGRLFATYDESEETLVIDICTGGVLEKIPNPKQNMCFRYLLEAVGDLLGVVGYFDPMQERLIGFEVYRLERNGDSSRWSKVSGIGDLMMFLDDDRNGSFCVSASDFDGFKGNCIYFVKSHLRDDLEICRYDMEEGREEVIVSLPNVSKGTWFLPTLF